MGVAIMLVASACQAQTPTGPIGAGWRPGLGCPDSGGEHAGRVECPQRLGRHPAGRHAVDRLERRDPVARPRARL